MLAMCCQCFFTFMRARHDPPSPLSFSEVIFVDILQSHKEFEGELVEQFASLVKMPLLKSDRYLQVFCYLASTHPPLFQKKKSLLIGPTDLPKKETLITIVFCYCAVDSSAIV